MRGLRAVVTTLALLITLPAIALAQASLTGVVRDSSGAVLPGVTVEAASPALIEKTRAAVTDGTGQYRIENLRPGAYTVTFTLTGFNTVKREGVELAGTATVTVGADLKIGDLNETITVTGETPLVDVQSATKERVISHDVIDAVPSNGNDRGFAILIPGMSLTVNDVGGTTDSSVSNLTIHGSRASDQRISINGNSIGISVGSGSVQTANANLAAYQEVAVDTAAAGADLATGGVRVNYIPRDGGNKFSGSFAGNYTPTSWQRSNYSDALKAAGLASPGSIKELYDVNPAIGGPIQKDKLWFFFTLRAQGNQNYPSGILSNLNANNPSAWLYVPDPSSKPYKDVPQRNIQLRLTWQATPKNKLAMTWQHDYVCYCQGAISSVLAPEADQHREFPMERDIVVDYTSPVSSRWLIDASAFSRTEFAQRNPVLGINPLMISVVDQALNNLRYRKAGQPARDGFWYTTWVRASASYVTGAHAVKFGFNWGNPHETTAFKNWDAGPGPVDYRFNSAVAPGASIPNLITEYGYPVITQFYSHDGGVFAQDKWTVKRLTVSYGLRFDYYTDFFPAQTIGPAPLTPTRNISFPDASGIAWKDFTPKSGAAYDLFGDGKTAVKVSLNKYLEGQGSGSLFGNGPNPVNLLTLSTTRSWNDVTFPAGDPRRGNFVPDCNLISTAANGECGAMADNTFGSTKPGTTYDPANLTGWGKRPYNWEFSTGVQRQLMPGVSVEVSYFRRWFGNFYLTDNRAVAASDYSPFSLTVPSTDSRLPGAGSLLPGFYNLNPNRVGATDNLITAASNYGNQIEHWNGLDFIGSVRRNGLTVQGGVSTGRTSTDNCEIVSQLPEVITAGNLLPTTFCHIDTPFLTQVKGLASYTVPKVDVLVSASLQNTPGPSVSATFAAANALIAPSLGRPLSGNAANATVNLIAPGTFYGDRYTQVDLRFGKVLRYGRMRTNVNLDLFNAFNSASILTVVNTFGGTTPWLAPSSIIQAAFIKLSAQVSF